MAQRRWAFFLGILARRRRRTRDLSAPTGGAGSPGLLSGPRLIADPAISERCTALLLNQKRQPGRQHAYRSLVAEAVQPSIPADESHRVIVR